MKKLLLNAGIYQTGWFICALGASRVPTLVVPVIAAMVALQLWLGGNWRRDLRFIVVVGAIGALVDSVLGNLGIMRFVVGDMTTAFAPPWLIALWIIFGTTIPHALKFLVGRPAIAALFGAMGGAGSYYAGDVVFGAIAIGDSTVFSVAVLAVTWAVLMPALSWLSQRPIFNAPQDALGAPQPVLDET